MRPVRPADAELIHGWVTHPKARFWMMQDLTVEQVRAEYERLDGWIGDGFLVERYDPRDEPIGATYDVRDGDVGMHFLCAPTDAPVPGFTRDVITAVMRWLFEDPAVRRVVVDPDARNGAVHALNELVGFAVDAEVQLPEKRALRSFCTRERFRWTLANRRLVEKAIGELAHERLFEPVAEGDRWRVGTHTFAAVRGPLDHWAVSHVARDDGRAPDVLAFVREHAEELDLEGERLGLYLEELTATLAALAYKAERALPADELAGADFQTVEARMTDGHPCFVANSGRLGWSAADYAAYAPEAGAPARLDWVGVRAEHAVRSGGDVEVPVAVPDGYVPIPVHPWQWQHRLAVTFAGDVARGDLVWLGTGDDEYQAQQSIRTFFNRSRPEQPYVKTALSVVNMGFVRGLSAAYMEGTPAINDWVAETTGLGILREFAAVGYRSPAYEGVDGPYAKMLAALWRESPVPRLRGGERLMTMAALLHVDDDGRSLAAALIERSGIGAAAWLEAYLDAYLAPLLRCYHEHDLVFMPHGENIILGLEDHVVRRVFFKDIAEEVVVMNPAADLPEPVRRIRAEVPDHLKPLSILTDVFDCVLRFLDAALRREGIDELWPAVAACAAPYDAFFVDRFQLSCLNRLQLRNPKQMVDLADPAGSLQLHGTLANPIAALSPVP